MANSSCTLDFARDEWIYGEVKAENSSLKKERDELKAVIEQLADCRS
ncbi:hypothetical protein [Candidatus Protochlamydia phocaeensis]|nr:hypothetical protein [Candidatus Protochlamydia phocaeensis]